MSRTDGFFSRWSRRKLAPRAGQTEPSAHPDAEAGAPEPLHPAPDQHSPARPAELSDEELAALPPIEDLTAETDLTPFLRAGVPALIRQAALRRMWSLDPAIRDFVGEARDYSYDWNVAGGVPVSGPLLPTDDVEATLDRMFSRLPENEGSGSRPSSDPDFAPEPVAMSGPSEQATPSLPVDEGVAERPQDAASAGHLPAPAAVDVDRPPEGAAVRPAPAAPADETPRRRRHGAARPKFDSF